MCSIVEDDFGDDGGLHTMAKEITISDHNLDTNEICKKCNKEHVVVKLDFKEAQCRTCFLLYVRHKFRATLGASKLVPRESNVLVYFDGSSQNIVLLDMINYALNQESFRKLNFNCFILFIDENPIKNTTILERKLYINKSKEILEQFHYKYVYYASIADAETYKLLNDVNDFDEFIEKEIKFNQLINSIECLTSQQDFLLHKRKNLLRKVANSLDCKFIFTSEIGSDLAKALLTNVAIGRGSSTALDVSLVDDRFYEIKILRPIRDLNLHEIQKYIELNKLNHINYEIYGKSNGYFKSIQNLTDSFVEDLQKNFASTVSTVFRTGDKIGAKSDQINKKCKFCHSVIDFYDSKTLFAIEYSRIVSTNLLNEENEIEKKANDAVNGLMDENVELSELKQSLCHGCRNIFSDLDSKEEVNKIFK